MPQIPRITAEMVREAASRDGPRISRLGPPQEKPKDEPTPTKELPITPEVVARASAKVRMQGGPTARRQAIREALFQACPQEEHVELLLKAARGYNEIMPDGSVAHVPSAKWAIELLFGYMYGRPAMTVLSAHTDISPDQMGGLFRALLGTPEQEQAADGKIKELPEGADEGEFSELQVQLQGDEQGD